MSRSRDRATEDERQDRSHDERLRQLVATARAVLSAREPPGIAEAAVEQLPEVMPGCVRASVVEIRGRDVELLAAHGTEGLNDVGDQPVELQQWQVEALREGKPAIVHDTHQIEDPTPLVARLRELGVRSIANVPMLADQEMVGILNVGKRDPHALSSRDVDVAKEVATQIAHALLEARLRERLEREKKELEAHVAERTRQLAERNAELETFAFSVSHDLRAPLRSMEGFAQALLEDYAHRLDDDGCDYAERIVASSRWMGTLIRDLVEYSRLTRAEMILDRVLLDAAVEAALSRLANEAAGAEVTVDGPLGNALAHPPTLRQVLVNLLSNALKFVFEGQVPRIRVYAENDADRVRLYVEDDGVGIAPEHRERIFRVFERLHAHGHYRGTGVGLAIVRKGVARMGGRVRVDSAPGRGSRFCIELRTSEAAP